MLEELDLEIQQQIINELAARCQNGDIRKPLGYLHGLVRKAGRGEFKLWSAQNHSTQNIQNQSAGIAAEKMQRDQRPPPPEEKFESVAIADLSQDGKAAYDSVMELVKEFRG